MTEFPKDYAASRDRFIARAKALVQTAGAEASSFHVPSRRDTDLFVDDVYIPAQGRKDRLFVILSGIHGLEAYAGSAIQEMLMQGVLPTMNRENTGAYIVHSMNPYGFKHHTRCTEHGVNLNRNCGAGPELYTYENPESLVMSDRFIPKKKVDSLTCPLFGSMTEKNGTTMFEDVTLDHFIKAVGPGQFKKPEGLEFGGFRAEPQIQYLEKRLLKIMHGYADVIVCDLHTGLGHRGRLHLLKGEDPASLDMGLFSRHFDPREDAKLYDFTSNDEEGFYKTQGATNDFFPQLADMGQRVCALTFEYGTLGHDKAAQLESLNRWLVEHQGTHYGYATPELEAEVKSRYLDKFYPREKDWQEMVLTHTRELFMRMLNRK